MGSESGRMRRHSTRKKMKRSESEHFGRNEIKSEEKSFHVGE
jgi:hypothetical protein